MNTSELATHFFLQVALIMGFCQLCGRLAKRIGQPPVVAEMIAGILVGPSLLGLFWPELFQSVFPKPSMSLLYCVAQLGLAAYMFVVGLDFRVDIVQRRLPSAVAVSVAGMVTPFLLGAGLGWYFYDHTNFIPKGPSRTEAMIFLGAAMCITAFPVLARIIHFKKLTGTTMGTVALGAGSIDDAAAWCLLAVVLASIDGNMAHALVNIGAGAVYVAVTLLAVRPALAKWARGVEARGELSASEFVFCLTLWGLGAWVTDLIGLHAVFGAFIMGAAMPRGLVAKSLIQRIEPLTLALLLPLFFTFSGLNTQMSLLNSGYLWMMAAVVLAFAILGKGIACWLAALATGLSNKEAMGIGTLMNARGLMELIIINIGLQRGLISAELFAILVIMAVVTTLMTSPLFELLVGKNVRPDEFAQASLPGTTEPAKAGATNTNG